MISTSQLFHNRYQMENLFYSYFKLFDIWETILSNINMENLPLEPYKKQRNIVAKETDVMFNKVKRESVKCHSSARKIQNTKIRFDCGDTQYSVSSVSQLVIPLCKDFCGSFANLNNGTWNSGNLTMKIDADYIYPDRPHSNQLSFNCSSNGIQKTSASSSALTTATQELEFLTQNITAQNTGNGTFPDQCCRILPQNSNTSIIREIGCDCPVDRLGTTCSTFKKIDCKVIRTVPDLNCRIGRCPVFKNSDSVKIDFYVQCFNYPSIAAVNRTGFNYYSISPNVLKTKLARNICKSVLND
eukprot:NODE_44_length_28780_cov_0.148496.p9 type:complete len:300 gc:universal NODE_44_length_28780_cov_0.148496:25184-26083(+)